MSSPSGYMISIVLSLLAFGGLSHATEPTVEEEIVLPPVSVTAPAMQRVFAITQSVHESYPKSVCAEEFGSGYRVADWRDIEAQYRERGSLKGFFIQTDLRWGEGVQVTVDGEPRWSANPDRVFFIERHDHQKPDHFLAHAQINGHQLSLGSWMGARPVLCVQKPSANVTAPAMQRVFAVTQSAHESYPKSVCANEFGSGYRVADWRDIEAQYRERGALKGFFAQTGLRWGEGVQVTVDGEPRWRADSRRVFFIERHDHQKPDHFLAHAQINGHQLSLGSWTGERPVLCVQSE
jgi:hypothetical protein